jgi:hypothetical protein
MAYTRRHFAKLLPVGAAMTAAGFGAEGFSGSVFAGSVSAGGGGKSRPAGNRLDKQYFETLTGTRFQINSSDAGNRSLTLLGVETPRIGGTDARRTTPTIESAILRFSAEGAELPEGTYWLKHDTAGEFPLYLQPGRPGRCLAILAHVPEGYLKTISIPRKLAVVRSENPLPA